MRNLFISLSNRYCLLASNFTPLKTALRVLQNRKIASFDSRKVNPTTMQIDSPEFRSIFTPELRVVSDLFEKNGFELRVAGGAVRDILLGQVPHDIDFATTATPTQMMELFNKEGIRMLNKRGEKHGTVTCRINDKANFEITTLRIDKLCDGRRAEVEFTTDWYKDANRRDLTVNSIFLGLDGTVYDYFDGIEHLKARKIVFVGDARTRIQEDYLRILRYFRFFGRLAKTPDDHDPMTLEAIKNNVQGLKNISGERLWTEFKRIVTGRFAGPVVKIMLECKTGSYLGLPETCDINEFIRLCDAGCLDHNPMSMTMVSGLLCFEDDVYNLDARLKLSNKERFLGKFIVEHRSKISTVMSNGGSLESFYKDLLIELQSPSIKLENSLEYVLELIKYNGDFDILRILKDYQAPKFPVDGVMLLQWGVKKGPAMKAVLNKLFEFWKIKHYNVTEDEFFQQVDDCFKRDRSRSPIHSKR